MKIGKKFKSGLRILSLFIIGVLFSTHTPELIAEVTLKGEIRGKIIDISSGQSLMGVNVFVEHTTAGSATNADGQYRIKNVPVGEVKLVASMIGYKMERRVINVSPLKVTTVNFKLRPTILEMGAIVVTGTGTPEIYEDTPVRTAVIPHRLIEKKHSVNLAEALSFTTGVRVENNCQNCNFSQVRILGMGGKYSQILIDGDPVISSLAGVYGLEQIPAEMIDQIEVVKGGGSSLYGGGAVAGVINLITRRPVTNQVHLNYLGNSTGGKMDHHVGAVAEFVNPANTSGGFVFLSARERTPYDYNKDGYSELGELKNESLGFSWYLHPSENSEFSVHFHRIHEQRRGGNKFDLPVHEAEIAEALQHWRWGGTLRWNHHPSPLFDYRLYYSFAFEKRKSYYGGLGGYTAEDTLRALDFYGRTDNPLQVGGAQMNYRAGNHLLTSGVQYSWNRLKDRATANPLYHIDNIYTNVGIFLQDNIELGSKGQTEFVIGARADKHSELNNWILSPRINGKFKLGRGWILRGAFTTGFKPPQIYDEDLHLCGVEGDQRVTRNAYNLKPEKSHSFSGGIEFQNVVGSIPVMFDMTGFYTALKGSFTLQFVGKTGNTERWERVNGEGANVKGIELDIGIRPLPRLEFRGGLTYKKSRYDRVLEDWNTRNFLRTPDIYGYIWMSLDLTSGITFFASGNYTGKALVPHEIAVEGQENPDLVLKESNDFFEIDLSLSFRVFLVSGVAGKINVGAKNIADAYQKDLDRGPNRDPAYVYGPSRPRTFYAGFEVMF